MDKLSYERRREDEQRRFVRFTLKQLPGKVFIYVDRHAIIAFGETGAGTSFIRVDGETTLVQEQVSEIKTALGIDRENAA